ncbi:MAG: PilZ domain-containing protein [Nitrospirota bacterium]
MKEQRREFRIPFTTAMQYLHYGDPLEECYHCTSVDISESGIGIVTDSLLLFGQFIEFRSDGGDDLPSHAVVQWSMPLGTQCRAGLFVF